MLEIHTIVQQQVAFFFGGYVNIFSLSRGFLTLCKVSCFHLFFKQGFPTLSTNQVP